MCGAHVTHSVQLIDSINQLMIAPCEMLVHAIPVEIMTGPRRKAGPAGWRDGCVVHTPAIPIGPFVRPRDVKWEASTEGDAKYYCILATLDAPAPPLSAPGCLLARAVYSARTEGDGACTKNQSASPGTRLPCD